MVGAARLMTVGLRGAGLKDGDSWWLVAVMVAGGSGYGSGGVGPV